MPITPSPTSDLAEFYGAHRRHRRRFPKSLARRHAPPGISHRGQFLLLTSNPTRTSPVKRGKWVLENVLARSAAPAAA